MNELETALKALQPACSIQRDQLLYRAGQMSVSRGGWLWPAATAGMTAVAAVLGTVLVLRPEPIPTEHVVFVPVERQAPATAAPEKRQAAAVPSTDTGEEIPSFWAQLQEPEWKAFEQQAFRWRIENPPGSARPEIASVPPTLGSLMNELFNGKFDNFSMK
jgi:hypothetical protein